MKDELGAFISHDEVHIDGAPGGPLAGLSFGAKDLYDVAGHVTGAGNPTWYETHEPATSTAPAVAMLLEAGATLVGKTHTDELAFSLNGENQHYGTPLNSAAPARVPGGSSCGSASAVAGGAVDFALGSDTGGSVRVPASYCGLYGIRPSHGRIPLDHVVPLAPSFDTVGWFTRDGGLLRDVGRVLLPWRARPRPARLLLARDAFALMLDGSEAALSAPVARLKSLIAGCEEVTVADDGLAAWMGHFRLLQAREAGLCHAAWIAEAKPDLGPGVAERFAFAATVSEDDVADSRAFRETAARRIGDLLDGTAVLCLPSAPGIAPLKGVPGAELDEFRQRALSLTAIAGLAGAPQVTLPLGQFDGCPIGLSLLAAPGCDEILLELAAEIGPES